MSDRLMMMRLMGCKFGFKKTERTFKDDPDDEHQTYEARHEVTIAGPSGMRFKAVTIDTVMCETEDEGSSDDEGDFEDNSDLVREIVAMIENDKFKPHELIDLPKDWPQNHIVFVLDTGDSVTYPPHGLRISVHDSFKDFTADLIEFFVNSEGRNDSVANQLIAAHEKGTMNGLNELVARLARERKWSICDQVWGYEYLNQTD